MYDVVALGELLIDFTTQSIDSDGYPTMAAHPGGAPANFLAAIAKFGGKAGMLGKVGTDTFGKLLTNTLRGAGIETKGLVAADDVFTTLAFVTLDARCEREFAFARKPGADMFLRESDVKESDIREAVIVHAGSCSLSASPAAEATVRALRLGRQLDKLVTFDVNYRDMMWPGGMTACAAKVGEILPDVDLLKIAREETALFGGEDALPALMERYGLTLVVETLGSGGARGYFRGREIRVSGRPARCADTTGAGDAFWGAFLSLLRFRGVTRAEELTEPLIREAMTYGNVGGWLCVQSKGAIASLPSWQEIRRHLA